MCQASTRSGGGLARANIRQLRHLPQGLAADLLTSSHQAVQLRRSFPPLGAKGQKYRHESLRAAEVASSKVYVTSRSRNGKSLDNMPLRPLEVALTQICATSTFAGGNNSLFCHSVCLEWQKIIHMPLQNIGVASGLILKACHSDAPKWQRFRARHLGLLK